MRSRIAVASILLAVAGGWLVGCERESDARTKVSDSQRREPTATSAPATCRSVAPDEDLEQIVEEAEPGARLCLDSGTYRGQFDLDEPIEIWGGEGTVIRNPGSGSTFRIGADGVELHDLRIVGSGDRYTRQDAGVFVLEADDVVLEGLVLRDVLFGISAQKSNRLTIHDNDIHCRHQEQLGMRGDGIRFWEVRRSRVTDNRIRDCRDLVVWYAPENYIVGNRYIDGRYGTHFMYSSRNILRENVYLGNSVGVFVMYSRHIEITDNVFARSGGTSGIGVGLKESGDLEIVGNTIVDNAEGTYIDASPLQKTNELLYALNDFRLNESAIVFHNEPRRTNFRANSFRYNGTVAHIEGGGSAVSADWTGNYFGTYAGYDFDDDGVGDVPFEMRSFTQTLKGRYPKLDFLDGTPAMAFIETATRLAPLYQPKLLVRDDSPRMQPPTRTESTDLREEIMREKGFLRIQEGKHVPLVDPPESSLSKEY